MSHEVHWTNRVKTEFISKANLTEDMIFVLETRIQGMPISCQADKLGCSTRTVDRLIKQMKVLYDEVQKEHPDVFPPRRVSKEEEYMDSH